MHRIFRPEHQEIPYKNWERKPARWFDRLTYLPPSLRTWIPFLGPTCWKERTASSQVSSLTHTRTVVHACACVHTLVHMHMHTDEVTMDEMSGERKLVREVVCVCKWSRPPTLRPLRLWELWFLVQTKQNSKWILLNIAANGYFSPALQDHLPSTEEAKILKTVFISRD